ncbi:MAG: 50S ribosomal protein L10 [Desulfobacterales bacterium]
MKLNEKQQIVAELKADFEKARVVLVADYKGLDVAAITALRRKLSEADVQFQVAKNTLLIRASEENDVALIKDVFKGPSAVALSYDDPVAPAKVLTDFAKEHNELEIKAGVMGGKVLDIEAIKALSSLPSREELLSQVLMVINGVPTSFVRALANIPERLLNVLTAIKDQKEAA